MALLSVAKRNTAAEQVVIDLRPLNAKYKKVNLYISKEEQNPKKLHVMEIVNASYMSNRQALRKFPLPKSPKVWARVLGGAQYYKHFLKNPSRDSAGLCQLKTQTSSGIPDWAVGAFTRIKQSLLESEAPTAPKFTMLQQN